jgi:hypothetical protein
MTTTLESRAAMGAGPLSERFDDALLFAARHHRNQRRKGSQVPYMSHLMMRQRPGARARRQRGPGNRRTAA